MVADTSIEWADKVWNPVTGCTKVSAGCKNCYAERVANRFWGDRKFTDMRCHPERLDQPLRWRKPRRIFVNSMSDLFHEAVAFEFIDEVYECMALAQQHSFQVLTKRPSRMFEWYKTLPTRRPIPGHGVCTGGPPFCVGLHCPHHESDVGYCGSPWPLPNVHLGVSVEDQKTADERIPLLLQTPAAVRIVSAEPLLGPIDFCRIRSWHPQHGPEGSDALCGGSWGHPHVRRMAGENSPGYCNHSDAPTLDGIIVGGESGPGARPCNVEWIRSIVRQCKEAGTPVFVKQLGSSPVQTTATGDYFIGLKDRKGADPSDWPAEIRVRELPT